MSAAPLQFLLMTFAGWVNRRQLAMIDYLKEENLVLRQQLGRGKLRFTDDQRRRLAVKGRVLGRGVLDELAGLVTPDTILRWYRELIAAKYDGTARRGADRHGRNPQVALVRRRRFGFSTSGSPPRTRPGATRESVMSWATLDTSSPAHDQAHPPRARSRTRALARPSDAMGHLLEGPSGLDLGDGLLHRRGAHARWLGPLLRPPAPRRLDEADRPQPHRQRPWFPRGQALPHPRSRPAVHRRVTGAPPRGG